jgi:hypothetical protein
MPAVSSMIPGRAPLLIRFIPSYGLVVTLGGVLQGTMGWSSIAPYVGTLAAWDAAMMITAFILLRRRIRSL